MPGNQVPRIYKGLTLGRKNDRGHLIVHAEFCDENANESFH